MADHIVRARQLLIDHEASHGNWSSGIVADNFGADAGRRPATGGASPGLANRVHIIRCESSKCVHPRATCRDFCGDAVS